MTLNEFIEQQEEDSNLFFRLSTGDHQNLLDQAIERIETLKKVMRFAKEAIRENLKMAACKDEKILLEAFEQFEQIGV